MFAGCIHYDFRSIEQFWQGKWQKEKTFHALDRKDLKKYYILDMFPYPSGAGLHIGHPEGYTATDIIARYKWAKGFNVLHPMGWDAFGLPAEQHAMKTGQHPAINTAKNISVFKKQVQSLGFAIDWDREINTTSPEYYHWTQWIFLQLFKHNLAYIADKPIWWCPELKAVLSNEEVIDGRSEIGNFPVERRNLRQWVLKITHYADKLLEGLRDLDWPESTKRQQIAWIGKSKGAEIFFQVKDSKQTIKVYTTRPDTIYGVTFLVLAPEHPLLPQVVAPEQRQMVEDYCQKTKSKSDLDRTDLAKDKTGVFSGSYAIHPLTGKEIPIWIADYVLATYGAGAIMAVPAHDTRDFEFARKFELEVIPVVRNESFSDLPFNTEGIVINSEEFDGLSTQEAKEKITKKLKLLRVGNEAQNFKLRDWLFSRQRYWGEPIPILWVDESNYKKAIQEGCYFSEEIPQKPVVCQRDGKSLVAIPLKIELLPLELPPVENYFPLENGESPLGRAEEWLHVFVDVKTGEIDKNKLSDDFIPAVRETNTMPQWAGSCWYYLRYMSPKYPDALVDPEAEQYWKSPDFYIGGAEHAVLHLLYARFWHQFLFDIGAISASKEPFQKLFHQGIILGQDGTKMSKSRGNVINPDDIVETYGADSLRLYEMFLGPLESMKPWNTKGIEGVFRFLKKVWALYVQDNGEIQEFLVEDSSEIIKLIADTVAKVTEDIENLRFNTAISQMMIFVNHAQKKGISRKTAEYFLQILAPFAPHISEELWARMGNPFSIAKKPWPELDYKVSQSSEYKIIIQINGKVRDEVTVPPEINSEKVAEIALSREKIKGLIEGKEVVKTIYVPGKILNIVVH